MPVPRLKPRVAMLMAHCVMAVLLLAGVAKLWNLPEFAHSLASWTLIPAVIKPPVVVFVPIVECVLGVLWFSGIGRRRVRFVAVSLLAVFTCTYALHVIFAEPPECNCLGKILAFERSRQSWVWVLGRNALLLSAMLGSIALAPSPFAQRRRSTMMNSVRHSMASGFTLIETIIVIAIMGILISLLAPALGSVRMRANDLTHIANLRSHSAIMSMYINDWDDTYPYFIDRRATATVIRAPGITLTIDKHFKAYFFWHIALAEQYYEGDWDSNALLPRDYDAELITPYWYSATFVSSSAFWNARTRTGPDQWRPVRSGQVTFPNAKGVVFNSREMFSFSNLPDTERPTVSVAFADGSARRIKRGGFTRPYPRGEGMWPGSVHNWGIQIMHTIDGVRGRDID